MLQKSSKHFIQPTAEKLDCDIDLVNDIVNFVYYELRKKLVSLKHHRIAVLNLGTFSVMPKEVPKLILKHERHLKTLNSNTSNYITLRKEVEIRLEKARNLKTVLDFEKSRYIEFKKWKNECCKKDLGESKPNS